MASTVDGTRCLGPTPAVAPSGNLSAPSPTSATGFSDELLTDDASRAIARGWVDGLGRLYAGDAAADPCDLFTNAGLEAARQVDPRLRAALDGERTIDGAPVLRIRFEGEYDLRRPPATVPMDVIFDLPAGSRLTDLPSGSATITAGPDRVGLHVTFVFDGTRWRAADVGPVSADHGRWAVLPTPVPVGDPCTGVRTDPAGAGFDDRSNEGGRTWCDALGSGRIIRQPDQVSMLTRYPCGRGQVAALSIGSPIGAPLDQLDRHEYLRDPRGTALDAGWITERWRATTTLPADAASTGWTNGNIELWVSPSRFERGVYLRLGDAFEWWPRASPDGWGVIDCN